MIPTRKESDEVLYPAKDVVAIDASDLDEMKRLAMCNPRRRIRLCAHKSPDDTLHEMFIVHARGCYVRPHKHLGKAESMAVLEGEADVVLFDDGGEASQVFNVGDMVSGKQFYYRIDGPIYHTLLIRTDFLVFHETTQGPFRREDTVFPDWAPEEGGADVDEYIGRVEGQVSGVRGL